MTYLILPAGTALRGLPYADSKAIRVLTQGAIAEFLYQAANGVIKVWLSEMADGRSISAQDAMLYAYVAGNLKNFQRFPDLESARAAIRILHS